MLGIGRPFQAQKIEIEPKSSERIQKNRIYAHQTIDLLAHVNDEKWIGERGFVTISTKSHPKNYAEL